MPLDYSYSKLRLEGMILCKFYRPTFSSMVQLTDKLADKICES